MLFPEVIDMVCLKQSICSLNSSLSLLLWHFPWEIAQVCFGGSPLCLVNCSGLRNTPQPKQSWLASKLLQKSFLQQFFQCLETVFFFFFPREDCCMSERGKIYITQKMVFTSQVGLPFMFQLWGLGLCFRADVGVPAPCWSRRG